MRKQARSQQCEYYKGFLICKCRDEFGSVYYTIVNTESNVHVHATTKKRAKGICDEAVYFRQFGVHKSTRYEYRIKGSKLGVRRKRREPLCREA